MLPQLEALRGFAPAPWAQIPDLGLYMDQVITFIGRACAPLYGEDVKRFLSPAMINNYVKARLIPRPSGKKYSREQIALLTMIVVLKQAATMEDIRRLLTPGEGQSVEGLYDAFCQRFTRVLRELQAPDDADIDPALDFAIRAAGFQAGCRAALEADGGSHAG